MSDFAGESPTRQWIARALLAGLVYLIAGLTFGALASKAVSHHMVVTWRLGAWALSAVVFATHILFDLFRARFTPSATAFHAAIGAGLGSLGLAAAATIHAHTTAHHFPPISLIVWPLLTGLPAFVVALVVAMVLVRFRKPA